MSVNYSFPSKTERHRHFGSVAPINGTKPTEKNQMPDLQNTPDNYYFPIQHVGVQNVTYPITIQSSLAPHQQTAPATIRLSTTLSASQKGINMSRLTEALQHQYEQNTILTIDNLKQLTIELAQRMEQDGASITMQFPWFFTRTSPKTTKTGLMHATVTMQCDYDGITTTTSIGIQAAVTTLCPCSKEISEYSAHNQRGIVTINATIDNNKSEPTDPKTDLLHIAESNASAMLHPILKRPDEKAVTETAYENPRFVEDLIRLIAADLIELQWVSAFEIECRNEESIHQHDAYAKMSLKK